MDVDDDRLTVRRMVGADEDVDGDCKAFISGAFLALNERSRAQ